MSTENFFFLYSKFGDFQHPIPAAIAVGSAFVYLFLIYVVAPLTTPQSPKAIEFTKSCRYIHNVFLFLFSLTSCSSCLYYLITTGEISFLWGDNAGMVCNAPAQWIVYLNYAFILSKVWEWGDTMFLVWLKAKGATSFLHVYHHATTFWLFLLVTDLPGPMKLGLLLNGGVHTLMYAHYAWPFPKRIVPLITVSQIAQLVYVTYVWSISPATCPKTLGDFPAKFPLEFATPYAFVPVYILFFIHFFVKRFLCPSKKRDHGSAVTSKRSD